MPVSGPEFEFRIAIRPQPGKIVVAARKEIDPGERLRVAAVEDFGEANDSRQYAHRTAKRAVEVRVSLV